jgi:hypothetical protein
VEASTTSLNRFESEGHCAQGGSDAPYSATAFAKAQVVNLNSVASHRHQDGVTSRVFWHSANESKQLIVNTQALPQDVESISFLASNVGAEKNNSKGIGWKASALLSILLMSPPSLRTC